jgi:serine/threonine protein kinase/formylglycine-generating enzyme required for sulfatase activity
VTHGPADPPIAGDIDEFRLIRVLGRGGMGAVYLAHDTLLDRHVAIKLIRSDSGDAAERARFLVEARAIARLSHPNVVAIYRAGTARAGQPYLAQELIRGQSLAELPRPVPVPRACELGLGVARGLAAAHRRGILHRDVKPANVMVDDAGTARLLDFGIAKLVAATPVAPVVTPGAVPGPGAPEPTASLPPGTADGPAFASTIEATVDLPRAAAGDPTPMPTPPAELAISQSPPQPAASPPDTAADGRIVGTPRYLAPELWRGAPATVRTDLYSLGVLLYELIAGAAPFAQVDRAALEAAVTGGPGPEPIEARVPSIDPDLATLIARCLDRDPARRPETADEVAHALERVLTGAPTLPEGNPYPGLAPFDASHRAVFYGRGADVSAVLDRLRSEPLVVIAGDSGVGKSSLCRAGLAPAIAAGALADGRRWRIVLAPVGRRPATALRDALGLAADVASTTPALAAALAPDRATGVVAVIDQLEELVTIADPDEARAAAELIAELAGGVPGIKVVLAVRGDFVTRVAGFAALGPLIPRGLQLVRLLDPEAVREAVVGPARAKGVRFATEAMIRELVDSVTGDAGTLPLLQFALAELWNRREVATGVIPAAATSELGGVSGALARHADGVLAALAAGERTAARRILLALVTRDGTRATRERPELVGGDPASAAALEALIRGRLVVARDNAGDEPVYTLAHESLLTAWGTLHGWLDDAAGQRRLRARVSAAADEWHRLGRRADQLWTRAQLGEAAGLDDLADLDRAFLAASGRAARRRLALRAGAIAAIPAIVATTWWAIDARERARRADRVDAQVAAADRHAAAAAITVDRARTLRAGATDVLIAADRAATPPEVTALAGAGEAGWALAGSLYAEARARLGDATAELEVALQAGVHQAVARRAMASALYDLAVLAEELREPAAVRALERRLVAYDDGTFAALWAAPVPVTIDAPDATSIELAQVDTGDNQAWSPRPAMATVRGGKLAAELPVGSYLARVSAPGIDVVNAPFVVERGRPVVLAIELPAPGAVPPGFAFVPAGAFLSGSNDETFFRRYFLYALPLHADTTAAFAIARHEVTFAEWMEYLRALPADEREQRRPLTAPGAQRSLRLEGGVDAPFVLRMQPTAHAYVAREGEPIVYPHRTTRARVRWERMHVGGVSFDDARAYVGWLRATGRVPGARLCTGLEWERATRGADGRRFPHGDRVAGDDANLDDTYGRDHLGPDEVGAHPASASPFGILDAIGNAFEWVVGTGARPTLRGGAWYFGRTTAMVPNSSPSQATRRDSYLGIRVCADVAGFTAAARERSR